MSTYTTSVLKARPAFESDLGSVTQITSAELPVLCRLSLKRVVLQPGAVREPQWNVDANQISYCLSGTVVVSVLGNGDSFSRFLVGPGQMYHVESGAVYHIENVGDEVAELVLVLRAEAPRHFSFADSVAAMTDAVLGNTYDTDAAAFGILPRGAAAQIVSRDAAAALTPELRLPDARQFDVETQNPPLAYPYGSASLARRQFWPALEDLSMYSLRIGGQGMREPHWHPVTAELGYVRSGRGRMRVLSPEGVLEEYTLSPGDVYFIPRAYPHHIESLTDEGVHFLVFFDQPMPGDVGYRATATAFSPEVLAASFGVPVEQLPPLPPTPIDPLIVPRRNPRDRA